MMAAGGGFTADGRPVRMDPLAALIQFATPYSNNPSRNVSANNSDHDSEDDLDQPRARTGKAGGTLTTPGTTGLKNSNDPQCIYGGQQSHGMGGWGPTLGGAPWHAAMQAKRALITDDQGPAHGQGPAVAQTAPMPGMMPNWGYPPTDPDAAAAAGWSPEQVQQFWAMQQQLAQMQGRGYADAARSEPTSGDEGSSVASTQGPGDKRYRRSSIVGGAAVLAGMSRQYKGSTATATISPIDESAPTEPPEAAAAKAPSKSKGARRSGPRGGSTAKRSSAKSSAKATERESARASTSSPAAGIGLAGKNSRAKETHRQAEQRRRGEQIKAVMELKTELDLHDGTPLGETLIQAADHIKALQESQRRLFAQIERLRKKRK